MKPQDESHITPVKAETIVGKKGESGSFQWVVDSSMFPPHEDNIVEWYRKQSTQLETERSQCSLDQVHS